MCSSRKLGGGSKLEDNNMMEERVKYNIYTNHTCSTLARLGKSKTNSKRKSLEWKESKKEKKKGRKNKSRRITCSEHWANN